ncbi:MAG: hypothetical protein JW728_07840 [Candidatus Aureabacteria bacterium]|nr:hypothetical protein [Candidatus Auribacterota bacterium]
MAYKCPRCGKAVQRGYSGGAQATAGLVGALFYAAFGAFECKSCGKIARNEFPPEDRKKILLGSMLLVVSAIAVTIGLIALLVNMK